MEIKELTKSLAALLYYGTPERLKGESFENLDEAKRKPFESLAQTCLVAIDKVGLKLAPKLDEAKEEELDAAVRSKIEAEIKSFFDKIEVWRKDLIPQKELSAKIYEIFKR